MQPEHPAIEPSITIGSNYGEYNSKWKLQGQSNEWFVNPFIDFQMGFTDRIGLEILSSFIFNTKKGVSSTYMQDSIVLLGFQIASDVKGSWIPDIRLDLQQTFPTGKYQKLDPKKLGTDSTGQGAFQTGPLLIIHKLFYPGNHFLSLKVSTGYLFPTNVRVQGLNAYGGGTGINGTVRLGRTSTTFFAAEYSIAQQWGCGFDFLVTYQGKSSFSGAKSLGKDCQTLKVGLPSSTQMSLAPYIEYSFKSTMGILWGSWFTLSGRNTTAFLSGFFAFLYVF